MRQVGVAAPPESRGTPRVGNDQQPSDFDDSGSSVQLSDGELSEEQDVLEAEEDKAAGYADCVWVEHSIEELELSSPVSASTRSPTKPSTPASLPDFASAPKFTHRKDTSHPKCIPSKCESAFDYGRLFLNDEVLNILVEFTNQAATSHPRLVHQRRFTNWKPTTAQEMLCFVGVCAYMGVVKIQNRKHAWGINSVYRQKWLSMRMSLRRFESLITAVNCAAAWTYSDRRLSAMNTLHSFWQMDELVTLFNRASKKYWNMGRLMSLDVSWLIMRRAYVKIYQFEVWLLKRGQL
jgi:hypothetical protein